MRDSTSGERPEKHEKGYIGSIKVLLTSNPRLSTSSISLPFGPNFVT